MFKKFNLTINFLSLIMLIFISSVSFRLPSISIVLWGMIGFKFNNNLFLILIVLSIVSIPFILTASIYIKIGKFIYSDVDDLKFRFNLFSKTVVSHYSLMGFIYIFMTFLILTFDLDQNKINYIIKYDFFYSFGIYQLITGLFFTSLIIPLMSFLIELFVISDSGISFHNFITESIFPILGSFALFLFSVSFEKIIHENYNQYCKLIYNEHALNFDNMTDTAYSGLMFVCIYSSVLNYNRIW